jgi:hypothetical protein
VNPQEKALPTSERGGRAFCRPGVTLSSPASSQPEGALAAAAAAVATVVVAVKAKPVAAAAAQQNEDDDEPSAVSVTHGKASFQVTLYLMAYGEKCYSLHFLSNHNFKN